MKISVVFGNGDFRDNADFVRMRDTLTAAGHTFEYADGLSMPEGTDILMSVGGDGTFLAASKMSASSGVPIVGVNLGRLGFLSENTPDSVAVALAEGRYKIQERSMLGATVGGKEFLALNEVCVNRGNGPMLGINVTVDGNTFPTCWADGLIVATPSGSTAYSLSAGGPIVMPSSKVVIIVPVAPHNLNVRPMIVPAESAIGLSFQSRSGSLVFSADNYSENISTGSSVTIGLAQFSLKRICLDNSNFIKALSEKLFWGEDKRNSNDR